MERCPCCQARLGGASLCPRCQADLRAVVAAESSAQAHLIQAIRHWVDNDIGQSANAICLSLRLKKIKASLIFRDFLIHQQCRIILNLLAHNKLLAAKHQLYNARLLMPYSNMLQHLQGFTDFLLVSYVKHLHPTLKT